MRVEYFIQDMIDMIKHGQMEFKASLLNLDK